MQRLDKILSDAGVASRKELREAIRAGRVMVNGERVLDEARKFEQTDLSVTVDGEPVRLMEPVLLMLNKPAGYLTAADDPKCKTVMELIPDCYRRLGIMPVGRLDKETEGLLLFTNDGQLAHKLISPKSGILKRYEALHEGQAQESDVAAFAKGLVLSDGTECLPAGLEPLGPGKSRITVQEGKYHQVRRMMAARNLPVTYLERISEGSVQLGDLPRGAVKELDIVVFEKELEKIL